MNASQTLSVVRACELEQTPPEKRWLIESMWGRTGIGVIGGTPKSLKSWLGLEMAVSVATDEPCLSHFRVHDSGPALVYPAEDTSSDVRSRLAALCAHRGVALDALDVHVITEPSLRLDLRLDCRRLADTVASVKPRLLLLDPFVRLHRADENHAQDIAAILSTLTDISRRHETAIALVHHTRKDSRAAQAGQNLRGSGDLHAWGSSNLYLRHTRRRLELTVEHRAAPAPEPFFIALDDHPLRLVVDRRREDPSPSLEERVVNELKGGVAPITRTALRARLAVNNKRLGDALQTLHRLGRITKHPKGWAL